MTLLTRIFAAAILVTGLATTALADPQATAADAKALLDRAVAALKADQATALANFNKPDGGFRDRELYVACFDATSGLVNAHVDPRQIGVDIRTIKSPSGDAFGQRLFDSAKEGAVATVDYEYPPPGGTTPVAKQSFVTRVANEGCLVGYYK